MGLHILQNTALAALLIPAALLLFILLEPFYEDARFRFLAWRKQRNGEDVGIPFTAYSFPFGIRHTRNMARASKSRYLLDFFYKRALGFNKLTVRQQSLGQFNIVTNDPENLKTVLSLNFKDYGFGSRHGAFLPLLGDGIFTLDGQGWHHSRTLLRPQFTRQQISHLDTIETHMAKLIDILRTHSTTAIDVQDLFFKLTIDTATEFLFGESVQSLSGSNPKIAHSRDFGVAFNRAQNTLADRLRLQRFYDYWNPKEFQEWCRTCKDFTDSYVQIALNNRAASLEKREKRQDAAQSKYVFLNELAKETQDPDTLRDQSLNILLAGRDTTASLLGWVFYNLALHKPVFFKLREEILASFGSGTDRISFESLKQCVYLRYVINETLRLYPIVPGNQRTAIRDTYLPRGGVDPADPDALIGSKPIFVPKGTAVGYSVYVMQRHPYFWGADANDFRPERWAGPARPNAHAWDFLPFNGGPRICLGQQFALNEASYAIVRLLQTFRDIVPRDADAIVPHPKQETLLTMSVHGGVNLKFIPE